MTGDLYPDGVIDVYDLILLRKELIEQKFSSFCDINNDKQVSVADLVMMNNHILGKENFKIIKRGKPPKKNIRQHIEGDKATEKSAPVEAENIETTENTEE